MNTSAIGLTFKGKARTAGYNNQHHNHQVAGGGFNKAQYAKNRAAMNMPHQKTYSQTDTFHRSAPGVAKNPNGVNANVVVEQTLPSQIFTKEALEGISDYIGGTASAGKPINPNTLQRIIAFLTAWFVTLTGTMPNQNADQIKAMTGTILNPPAIYEEFTPEEIPEAETEPEETEPVTPPITEPEETVPVIPPVTEPEETEPVIPPDEGGNEYPSPPTTEEDTVTPPETEDDPAGGNEVDTLPEDIVVTPQEPDPVDPNKQPGSTLPDPDDLPIVGGDTTDEITPTDPDEPKIEVDTDDDFSGTQTNDPSQGGVDTPAVTEPEETEPITPPVTEPEETEPEVTEPITPPVTEPEETEPEVTEPVTPPVTEPEETEPEETEPTVPPIIRDEEDEF